MTPERFQEITDKYRHKRIAVVGDFCLDRYLEIDPALEETSIETGLPVHNVVNVRSQPGGAGTILNNLAALGIREIVAVGFCGEDGEGAELTRALSGHAAVSMDHFIVTGERRTFTYCKPLLVREDAAPEELSRLDSKNWTPTPEKIQDRIGLSVLDLAGEVHGMILLEQADRAETGVITQRVLERVRQVAQDHPGRWILADSRRSLSGYPPVCYKMNRAELASMQQVDLPDLESTRSMAARLAGQTNRPVFVTLAEQGIIGAADKEHVYHRASLPVRGPIDIVGAGDAVTANLVMPLVSGATVEEAIELANLAASHVIHQVGTTGAATVEDMRRLL